MSEGSEKSSAKPETLGAIVSSVALEMKHSIVALGRSPAGLDTRESMIARAARRAGITFRQARALFYGETTDPKYSVVERIRQARAAAEKERADAEAARDEYHALLARIAACEEALRVRDADFHRDEIHARRAVLGRVDRALDRGDGK